MPRALLDVTPLSSAHALRGIGAAVNGWLAGFLALAPDARPRVLVRDGQTPPGGFEADSVAWPHWRRYRLPDPWPVLAVERRVAAMRVAGEVFQAVQPALDPARRRRRRLLPRPRPARFPRAYLGGAARAPERAAYHRYLGRLAKATLVVTPSQATADDVVALAGVDPTRLRVVPHGVPAASPAEGEVPAAPYVLFAGGLEPHKNAWCALEAAAQLRGRARLVMTGPWSRRGAERLSRRARAIAAADRVVLLGFVPPGRMTALRRGASATLVPSWAEGFGLPVVEAMAAGCPVIAADVPSLREAGGDAAVYLPPGDAAAWARTIDALADDDAERARLAAAGAAHVAGGGWEAAARALSEVWAEAATS